MNNLLISLLLVSSLPLLPCCSTTSFDQTSLAIKDSKKKSNLRMSEVAAEVRLYGDVAETTLVVTFRNDTSRDLEAVLQLPLPEGATISRYALEVEGKMKEGVLVDKDKGRKAYEEVIRGRIDPGLLEKLAGNSFKTRIYPVPAKGTKKVLLSYIEPLKSSAGMVHYSLPISFTKKVDTFRLKMHSEVGKLVETSKALEVLPDTTMDLYKKNFKARKLTFTANGATTLTQPFGFSSKDSRGQRFFYVTTPLEESRIEREKPKSILVVWDASHSAVQRDLEKERQLLQQYLKALGNVKVRLKVLRNQLIDRGSFSIVGGDASALLAQIKAERPDGSTALGHVSFASRAYGATLLFSDGISVEDDAVPAVGTHPVFCINSGAQGNDSLLRHLAKASGGDVLSAADLNVSRLLYAEEKLIKVTGSSVSQGEVREFSGKAIAVGRVSSADTTLTLHYAAAGSTTKRKQVRVRNAKVSTSLPAKMWAQAKMDKLAVHKKKNRSAIVGLSRRYGVVSDFTSLIVLDRIEDYVRYEIVPPEANQRKAYYAQRKQAEPYQSIEYADLDEIYFDWQNLTRWHQGKKPKVRDSMVGLRTGETAITRDSINFFLNNPQAQGAPASGPVGSIKVQPWNPQTPYMRAIKRAKSPVQRDAEYFKQKQKYGSSAGFYLDCALFFSEQGDQDKAVRILSNLAETHPDSVALLRVLAGRYLQVGEYALAEKYFRKVKEMRPEEPQSYRDLAIALTYRKKYQEASDLYWTVVKRDWDWRFKGIEMIALNEWNHLVKKHRSRVRLKAEQTRFLYALTTDVRVVISWDTDNSDMDLWVTDPSGEKCYYGNTATQSGGRISKDMMDGRGPEEFMIKTAQKGKYKVEVDYYGTREQTLIGPTTLQATFISNWGKANEKRHYQTLRLSGESRTEYVGDFEWK